MVTLDVLLPAILVSGLFVLVGSFIIWLLPHHRNDFKALPNENAVTNTLRQQKLTPGLYNFPHLHSRDELKKPGVRKKFEDGPCGFLTVAPHGMPPKGKNLLFSFVYFVAVSFVVAYVAGRTLTADAAYLTVFRLTGTVAWLAYGAAAVPDAIWFARPWRSVLKQLVDALGYALLTAGVFGWLWP